MASSQSDIIARLRLNAESFSADSARLWGQFGDEAKQAGSEVKTAIGSALAEVQSTMKTALATPSTDKGSIDLGTEALRRRADAAHNEAIALREVAVAAERVVNVQGRATDEARAYATASALLAQRAEENAFALTREAQALDQVQIELNRGGPSAARFADEQDRIRTSSGAARAGLQQAGFQVQDFFVQVNGGTDALKAFSMQAPQLIGSMQMMAFGAENGAGKFAKFASFIGRPWGIALGVAIPIVGGLASKLLDQGDAAEKAAKATKDHETAIDNLRKTMDQSIQSATDRANATAKIAEAERLAAIRTRESTQALLENARAMYEAQKIAAQRPNEKGEIATLGLSTASDRIAELEKKLAANKTEIDRLTRTANIARGNFIESYANDLSTPEGRIKNRYDGENGLIARAKLDLNGKAQADEIVRLTRAREAEIKSIRMQEEALRKKEQEAKRSSTRRDGDTATPAQVSKILVEQLNARITSTTGGKHVAGSDHYRGQAIDFVPAGGMNSITKEQIRAVFAEAGVNIRRNKGGVEQLFGPGDKGHDDHFHVAWDGGKGAIDSARIAEGLARKRQQIDDELTKSTDALVNKYDEVRAAADAYSSTMADIDRLYGAQRISESQRDQYRQQANEDYAAKERQIAKQRLDDLSRDLSGTLNLETVEQWASRQEEAAREIENALVSGADSMSTFFGSKLPALLVRAAKTPNGTAAGNLLSGWDEGMKGFNEKLENGISTIIDKAIGADSAKLFGKEMATAFAGARFGSTISTALLGSGSNQLGSQIGGALGEKVGEKFLTKGFEKIAKGLGEFAGPVGSIVGGVLGGVIGKLFGGDYKALSRAYISNDTSDSWSRRSDTKAVDAASNTIQSTLQNIADQFGSSLGKYGVTFGMRDGEYRVSGDYGADVVAPNPGGLLYRGGDAQSAAEAAIVNAIQDGAISGLSEAAKRIIAAGGDLDAALKKALTIESIPKDLKKMTDPLGAAIDELDAKFAAIRRTLQEAGADAETSAQAQQLYNLQLADLKDSMGAASDGLKDFLQSLKVGSSSPLSLAQQEVAARSALDPYLSAISSGQSVDKNKYIAAAQDFLDVERKLYGSTGRYFDAFNEIQEATNKAIATIDNATPIRAAESTATATQATAASAANMETLLQQIATLTAQNNALLQTFGGDASWLSSMPNYA